MRFIVHLKGQAKGQDEWIYAIHKTQKKKKRKRKIGSYPSINHDLKLVNNAHGMWIRMS